MKQEGKLTTSKEEVTDFDKLLNIQSKHGIEELTYYTANPLVEAPTLDEVEKAFLKLKNNKAPGNATILA